MYLATTYILLALWHPAASSQSDGDESVQESSSTFTIGNHTYEIFRSAKSESHKYYVAPLCKLAYVDAGKMAIAKYEPKSKEIKLKLILVPGHVSKLIEDHLRKNDSAAEVYQLRCNSLLVDITSDTLKREFGVKRKIYNQPEKGQMKDITIEASVDGDKLADLINNGTVEFAITYTYNEVSITEASKSISINDITSHDIYKQLEQKGSYLVSIEQANSILSKCVSKVIAREESDYNGNFDKDFSIGLDDLLSLISIDKIYSSNLGKIADYEKKLHVAVGGSIDIKDFMPIQISMEILDVMNKSISLNDKKRIMVEKYSKNTNIYKSSAGLSFNSIGDIVTANGSLSSSYDNDFNSVFKSTSDNIKDVNDFLSKYHGIKYNDVKLVYRGLAVCDLSVLKSTNNVSFATVKIRRKVDKSFRNVTSIPIATSSRLHDDLFSLQFCRVDFHDKSFRARGIPNPTYKVISTKSGGLFLLDNGRGLKKQESVLTSLNSMQIVDRFIRSEDDDIITLALDCTRSSNFLAVHSRRSVRIYDTETWELYKLDNMNIRQCCVFGKYLYCSCHDNSLSVINMADKTIKNHSINIEMSAMTTNGKYICFCNDKGIALYDIMLNNIVGSYATTSKYSDWSHGITTSLDGRSICLYDTSGILCIRYDELINTGDLDIKSKLITQSRYTSQTESMRKAMNLSNQDRVQISGAWLAGERMIIHLYNSKEMSHNTVVYNYHDKLIEHKISVPTSHNDNQLLAIYPIDNIRVCVIKNMDDASALTSEILYVGKAK